jgi:hypothetical protein
MSYGTVQAEKMTTESGYSLGAGNASSFKNRIINGNMTIAQRGTAAITVDNAENFPVDRTTVRCNTSGISATTQQSVTAPSNFRNSLLVTVTTGAAAASTDRGYILQKIEGYNVADFMLGTASATTFTFSFWVRSSLTGTFSGSFQNNEQNRSYVFTYTVSSANTWEQKTISLTADTTGNWDATSTAGLFVLLDCGMGSSLRTSTTGSWIAGDYRGTTGSNSLFANSGATFYTTGWQLEVGTVATSFDYRPYGTELALCQRYYEKSYDIATVPNTATTAGQFNSGGVQGATTTSEVNGGSPVFAVQKRATPTVTVFDTFGVSGKVNRVQYGVTNNGNSTGAPSDIGQTTFTVISGSGATASGLIYQWTASAEL